MTKFSSRLAASLVPYVPGEQPKDKKYIKLNTNENPYPPSPKVKAAIESELENLRLYPDPDADKPREAAAEYFNKALGLTGEDALTKKNIFMGNGSDEILALLCPAFFSGSKVAFPDITYTFYPVIASLFEVPCVNIPLRDDFTLDQDAVKNLPDDVAGMFLCNPNAPTGAAISLDEIKAILEADADKLIVVDEAYVDFGAETAVGLVNKYDNLLVVQTLSKSRQLAGIRCGLAIANEELIGVLDTVKNTFNSYTLDRLGNAAACAAFADVEYFDETRKKIADTRDKVSAQLSELGWDVIPSKSNFIFAQPPAGSATAEEFFHELRGKGILVRYFAKPRINNRLRITIGTPEDMETFVGAVKEIMAEHADK